MRIAVAGCGIAGTTVAFQLAEKGHDVTIFEQAEICRPVGAGIMLQPSGQSVLRELDILPELEPTSAKLHGMTAELTTGKQLVSLDFTRLNSESYALGVHRGRLFERLLKRCKEASVEVINSFEVQSFDETDGIVKSVEGESKGKFNFLIATDGSRSRLRDSSSIRSHVKNYRYGAFWITGKCDFQPGELFQIVQGTHILSGLLPIGQGESSFFWGLPVERWPSLRESSFSKWRSEAIEIFPQSESLLAPLTSFDSATFGTYRNVSMSKWFDKGVIFLGDSAHATSPHLGQGVNLALEDAITFANAFHETEEFRKACELYSKRRKSKLRYYQRLTKFLTPFFQSEGWVRGALRDTFLPMFPKLPLIRSEMLRTLSGSKQGWMG